MTSETVASNLLANGCNFYGAYATANQGFVFFYNGTISEPFRWLDSYTNQIWMNAQLQLAIMELFTQITSVPYNAAGSALIEAACLDPINRALSFGAIRTGINLSVAQIAEVNNAAGVNIAPAVQQQGWYLQVGQASPQVRAARGSPPCNFWHSDGEAVQQITLDSIDIL